MNSHLTALDVVVLFAYLIGICAIGAVFYRRSADLREYFVAGRQIPAFVVVVGLAASYTSSISYLGVPSYAYRVNILPFASIFAAPFALWVVSRMFLPFFFKLNVITCYEYLELRFGEGTRKIASLLFLISRMFWLILVVYGTAVALKYSVHLDLQDWPVFQAAGLDPELTVWVALLALLGTGYTMLGGMRAVMWTDLLQFCMLCFGLLATIFVAASGTGQSIGEIWETASTAGRTRLLDFHFSWTSDNIWAALAGGFFISMSDQGLDQIATQRYLSAKSLRDSQQSAMFSLLVNVPLNALLYGAGLVLFVLYGASGDPEVARLMNANPDTLMTYFFFDRMPSGVLGLMLATILAATMSCLTAGVNSLSASTIVDLYATPKKPRSSKQLAFAGRVATVLWGIVVAVGAVWMNHIGTGIMEASYLFLGLAASLNLGIFLTGMLIPRAGQLALYCAIFCGAIVDLFVVKNGFHWLWFAFFGGASIVAGAAVFSIFLPNPNPGTIEGLTYWTRSQPVHRGTAVRIEN